MREGYLRLNDSERYELEDANGKYLTYFTSGEPLEVFYDGEWLQGRVEHSTERGGYYFHMDGGRHRSLYNGLAARTVE